MSLLDLGARHHLAHEHVAEGVGEFDAALHCPVGDVSAAGEVVVRLLAHGVRY